MVTDDPETPGDGNWEINLGSIGTRTRAGWLIQALDADVNYGWGERVQLRFETPWNLARQDGSWASGLGTSLLGVKWRFLENKWEKPVASAAPRASSDSLVAREKSEVEAPDGGTAENFEWTISTYPQAGVNLAPYSARRGVVTPGHSIFLPVESALHLGPLALDFELGRNMVQQGSDSWVAGAIVAHAFTPHWECMLETRARLATQEKETLLNLGSLWDFAEGYALLTAVGRELGTAATDRVTTLYYLGVQVRL